MVVKSRESGLLHVGEVGWKSEDSFLISFSKWGDRQEAMLLMPCGSWVRTEVGRLTLVRSDAVPWRASLTLEVRD